MGNVGSIFKAAIAIGSAIIAVISAKNETIKTYDELKSNGNNKGSQQSTKK